MGYQFNSMRCDTQMVTARPSVPYVFSSYIHVILSYLSLYQHDLPLLNSTVTIDGLQPEEMVAYIHGYRPGIVVPQNRDVRIRLIKLAIGCSLD